MVVGRLFALNPLTGKIRRNIVTPSGSSLSPSGLAHIAVKVDDPFRNPTAEAVYAGDLNGDIWRFDLEAKTVARIAATTGPDQPITTELEIGSNDGKTVLFVATGKYIELDDLTTTTPQSIYAFYDTGIFQSLPMTGNLLGLKDSGDVRTVSNAAQSFGNGWRVNFPAKERVSIDPILVNGVLIVASRVPEYTSCSGGGYGYGNFFDFKTGGSPYVNGSNVVSERMSSAPVGVNVFYNKDGSGSVSFTNENNETKSIGPGLAPDVELPETMFKENVDKSFGRRSVWRELVPE